MSVTRTKILQTLNRYGLILKSRLMGKWPLEKKKIYGTKGKREKIALTME